MSKQTWPDCLAFIPHAIDSHWDNFWAPRLAGFPVDIVYAARIEGVGLAQATYIFDPGTFVESEQSRQMRYRPEVESDFSVVVKLHRDGGIDTFKYCRSELICEASGADFRSAMIQTTSCGLSEDEFVDSLRFDPAIGRLRRRLIRNKAPAGLHGGNGCSGRPIDPASRA